MKRLLLDGPELRRDIPPAPVTRAEPVVRLRSGLTLDDRSCWQYPTMLVGSVGSGKSTLLDQIQQPVLAHAAKAGDAVVIFAAKPDVLRYRRPGDPVISVSASDPGSRWDIFAELKAYTDNGTEDLMKYFYESDYVKQHVRSLVPSVEVWNRRLWGCTTVRADDDLSEPGWDKLMDYLAGQYSDGWGEGFEQREIETEDGLLYVHFWQDHDFDFKVEEVTPSKKYEITDIAHPKDPSLHRIRALQRVSETVGPGTLGGYVQSEENLSQENDDAWIYGDAVCCEKAFVSGNAFLTGQARVSGTALVAGTAEVGGQARVCDYAVVTGGTVQECALVCGHAVVRKNPSTECIPMVEGHATVMGVVAGAVYLGADAFILPGNTVDNPTNSVLAINGTHVRLYSIEQVKPPKAPER